MTGLDETAGLVVSSKAGTCRPCETCGESKADGRRECGKCRSARFRQDPDKAERSRAASRRWKAEQFGRQLEQWARDEVVS